MSLDQFMCCPIAVPSVLDRPSKALFEVHEAWLANPSVLVLPGHRGDAGLVDVTLAWVRQLIHDADPEIHVTYASSVRRL